MITDTQIARDVELSERYHDLLCAVARRAHTDAQTDPAAAAWLETFLDGSWKPETPTQPSLFDGVAGDRR